MWKDLTPIGSFHILVSDYLSATEATLIHMIIGQNFWYLKLLFVIQIWQIYVKFR
jgi:hypothetical protein